jgi:tetratricopeptide (TPR) repeat protein
MLGSDHPDTLAAMHYMAWSYLHTGRRGEALALGEKVLAQRRKVLGSEHPDTLNTMAILAIGYEDAGQRAEAIDRWEQVLALRHETLGEEHPKTLLTISIMGRIFAASGQWEEAMNYYQMLVSARSDATNLDTSTMGYSASLEHLRAAVLYARLGDWKTHRKHCQIFFENFGGADSQTAIERACRAYLIASSIPDDPLLAKILTVVRENAATVSDDQLSKRFAMTQGLAEYRAGNTKVVLPLLNMAEDMPGVLALKSMATHATGDTEKALEFLAEAEAEHPLGTLEEGGSLGDGWQNQIIAQLLLEETYMLVTGRKWEEQR